jgi:hypothetical protein
VVYAAKNSGGVTGTMQAVFDWLGVGLAVGVFVAVLVIVLLMARTYIQKLIDKKDPALPAIVALFAAALAGAANDLVTNTEERIVFAILFGIAGYLGAQWWSSNRVAASLAFLVIPVTLVVLVLTKSDRRSWVHEQGATGWISLVLILVIFAGATFLAWSYDKKRKKASAATV